MVNLIVVQADGGGEQGQALGIHTKVNPAKAGQKWISSGEERVTRTGGQERLEAAGLTEVNPNQLS